MRIEEAVGPDGTRYPYVKTDNPPRGGMKHTYFAPDRSYVVQFFNDPADARNPALRSRLEAILTRYNPTVPEAAGGAAGNTERTAAYFAGRFCWPLAMVESPEFGIVCPTYPPQFFFGRDATVTDKLNLEGTDKRSNWFTSSNRKFFRDAELGDFRTMLSVSIRLARAVRRLHAAGLAHSDLSNNNVLIDPVSGDCVIIDIDSLVVPNMYPPEVAGTRGYIAPEVLATLEYERNDPRRQFPRIETDDYSLPVLIYQYLFLRHPLQGPKVRSTVSAEEDEFLEFGPQALFIEDPHDASNRPPDLGVTIDSLGPGLRNLFVRAFSDGLHRPEKRPSASEWEQELEKAWDLLHPCSNPDCPGGWFVLHDPDHPVCPHCGTRIAAPDLMQLRLKKPAGREGQWRHDRMLVLYDGLQLFRWHVFAGELRNERADRTPQARVAHVEGQWLLVNENMTGMISPKGNLVPRGQAIRLEDGALFRISEQERGRLVEVVRG